MPGFPRPGFGVFTFFKGFPFVSSRPFFFRSPPSVFRRGRFDCRHSAATRRLPTHRPSRSSRICPISCYFNADSYSPLKTVIFGVCYLSRSRLRAGSALSKSVLFENENRPGLSPLQGFAAIQSSQKKIVRPCNPIWREYITFSRGAQLHFS